MPTRKMRVMPAIEVPDSHASILQNVNPGEPAIVGEGPLSLLCGSCDQTLAKDIHEGQLEDIFIRCSGCGSLNNVNP